MSAEIAKSLSGAPDESARIAERAVQQRKLAEAFACFSDVAESLERSYESLRVEVERLRRELAVSHARRDRAEDQARRNHALAEVSSVLAHEIRNPLGSMELFAGLLLNAPLDGECRTWATHLQAGLRTLESTVNNVLDFHADNVAMLAATDMGALMAELHEFVSPQAALCRVKLLMRNELQSVITRADRSRIFQVLLNLVLNGFRFMPGGGCMEIVGRRVSTIAGEAVMMRIRDSGPGIAPQNLGRVFEAGFTTRPGSPGLGLAVSKKIVGQHAGTITAYSRPGRGAIFEVRIPLVATSNWLESKADATAHREGTSEIAGEVA